MTAGIIEVWRIRHRTAQDALRAILSTMTDAPLDFARSPSGKPFLPGVPELKFNLSHSRDAALVGVALEVEIGVDVERLRALADHVEIAERFFPPSETAAHADVPECDRERDFFRRWTRIEAVLKARGVGLYGAGEEAEGEWTIQEIDMGDEYAAAVAAPRFGMLVKVWDF
jgi:4'-phosphopantetheinyl transferase